jgi:type VI secretion system secreted protein VgrG
MLDVYTIRSTALPKGTQVIGFRGVEGISRLYAFEIHLALGPDAGDAFELSGAAGAGATLVLDRQDSRPPFVFHGIFSEASLVHHAPDGRAVARAVLVPRLWRLTQTHHSRIFTQQSIPDILKKTLEDGGLAAGDYSLQLSGQYPVEEHVCQYRESHFDFLSRWMEREGLYYWFEQGDDAEKLIVADGKLAHESLAPAPVRFFPLLGHDASAGECLQSFACRHRVLPASVRFKDQDYTKPALDVSATAPVSAAGRGEISVHGARFFTPQAGQRLARLRAEEMLAREQVFTGSGTAFYLRAGYTFDLHDHPRASFDAKYLVTEVEHHGNQAASAPEMQRLTGLSGDEVYRVEVTAISAAVQFRAELRAAWPRIYGTEHGIVDGEVDSEYAQLDEHGRYLVRFAFDESDLGDGKASTRVRMMQPHGGGVEGWHFPLRKGTEVLFTFLGGDPDRPVIAGVVPNALTPSPVTKGNQTRNVIQTGGRNRLEIEDKEGFERITLSTPYANTMIRMGAPNDDHSAIIRTDANALLSADGSWQVHVGKNLTEYVHGETEETYQGDHTTVSWSTRLIEIGGPYIQNCHNNVTRKVYVDETTTIDGDWKTTVGGTAVTTVSADVEHIVGGSEVHIVGGSENHVVSGAVTQNYGPTVGAFASVTWTVNGPVNIMTPNWNVISPKHGWVASTSTEVKGHTQEFTGLSIEGTAVSIEATGSLNEVVVVHRELTAAHFELIGVHIEGVGSQVETVGKKFESGALTIMTFGLVKM